MFGREPVVSGPFGLVRVAWAAFEVKRLAQERRERAAYGRPAGAAVAEVIVDVARNEAALGLANTKRAAIRRITKPELTPDLGVAVNRVQPCPAWNRTGHLIEPTSALTPERRQCVPDEGLDAGSSGFGRHA